MEKKKSFRERDQNKELDKEASRVRKKANRAMAKIEC